MQREGFSTLNPGPEKKTERKQDTTSMAEENNTGASIEDLSGKTEQFIENNSRNLVLAIAAVAIVIVAIVGYGKFMVEPAELAANEDAWRAEQYFMMDSTDLALNGDGLYSGLLDISEDHSGTKAASRASYELGVLLRAQSDFTGAIAAFEAADLSDDILATIATINIGDCEVELSNYDAASSAFDKAIGMASSSAGEDYLAPIALYKGALVDLELGNDKAAKAKLSRIADDYASSNLQATAQGLAASIAR